MDDVTPGTGYEALRKTAAALQAHLANGLHDLPPELSLEPARARVAERPHGAARRASMPAALSTGALSTGALSTISFSTAGPASASTPPDPSVIPAAGGLPAVARPAMSADGSDLTPIFHALASGARTPRQPEQSRAAADTDPSQEFYRDPLGAPIPRQATPELGKMAEVRPLRPLSAGRHRRDRPAASEAVWTR